MLPTVDALHAECTASAMFVRRCHKESNATGRIEASTSSSCEERASPPTPSSAQGNRHGADPLGGSSRWQRDLFGWQDLNMAASQGRVPAGHRGRSDVAYDDEGQASNVGGALAHPCMRQHAHAHAFRMHSPCVGQPPLPGCIVQHLPHSMQFAPIVAVAHHCMRRVDVLQGDYGGAYAGGDIVVIHLPSFHAPSIIPITLHIRRHEVISLSYTFLIIPCTSYPHLL